MAGEPVTLGRHWDREAKGAGGRHILIRFLLGELLIQGKGGLLLLNEHSVDHNHLCGRTDSPGLFQKQKPIFIEHGLGTFEQLRRDSLKFFIHFMVVIGGGEGALVDMVGQEAMEGVLKGGESCLVIRVQDRTLMFVQMLQEAGFFAGLQKGLFLQATQLAVILHRWGLPWPRHSSFGHTQGWKVAGKSFVFGRK